MDVLLLNLAELVTEGGENQNYIVKQVAVPPMGLLYMGQVLSEAGYTVKIYDQLVTGTSNADLMSIIKKLDPKIVGFSVLYNNFWTTVDLLKRIKAWNPNVVTVATAAFSLPAVSLSPTVSSRSAVVFSNPRRARRSTAPPRPSARRPPPPVVPAARV